VIPVDQDASFYYKEKALFSREHFEQNNLHLGYKTMLVDVFSRWTKELFEELSMAVLEGATVTPAQM
jgi:hypothetical protein